jgi:O-antigen/teichoic acid export membrane protein
LAAPLLHLLFHDRWNGSICLVQILSLALSFDAVPWVAGALLDARREFWKTLICALVAFPWFFILVGLGAWLGRARGVAVAVGLYYAVFGPCYSFVAMR